MMKQFNSLGNSLSVWVDDADTWKQSKFRLRASVIPDTPSFPKAWGYTSWQVLQSTYNLLSTLHACDLVLSKTCA